MLQFAENSGEVKIAVSSEQPDQSAQAGYLIRVAARVTTREKVPLRYDVKDFSSHYGKVLEIFDKGNKIIIILKE